MALSRCLLSDIESNNQRMDNLFHPRQYLECIQVHSRFIHYSLDEIQALHYRFHRRHGSC